MTHKKTSSKLFKVEIINWDNWNQISRKFKNEYKLIDRNTSNVLILMTKDNFEQAYKKLTPLQKHSIININKLTDVKNK